MPETLRADLVVTWVAALGALGLLGQTLGMRGQGLLERRTLVLLATLGSFCALRGLSWMEPEQSWLQRASAALAASLPLMLALFVEGLLRRHLPIWMKLLAAATSAAALGAALFRADAGAGLAVSFGVALLVVMGCLCGFLMLRDPRQLSPAENDLILASVVAGMVAIPLIATEFRPPFGGGSPRLGGVAVLGIAYVLARVTLGRNLPRRLLWDAGWRLAQGFAVAAVILVLAAPERRSPWAGALGAGLALVLLFEIWERLTHRIVFEDDRGLLRWLARAELGSGEAFRASLRRYPLTEEHLLLGPEDLDGHSPETLSRAFPEALRVRSAAQVRHALRGAAGEALDANEQLLDILSRHEMSHACLLSAEPLRILLVSLPEVAVNQDAEIELQVIQRWGSVAIANHDVHA